LTEDEIFKGVLNLNPNKGAGPDDIPSAFLINCAESLVKPLHFIFNSSLTTGIFPSKWKKSFLTPIYKSGSRSDINNYRGIAILSAIPKFFEKLVCEKLTETISSQFHDRNTDSLKTGLSIQI
jgi:hypothetical protein